MKATGKVYLVGAGPGDPELLTVKALRILREADAVLHDDLVTPEILALIRPDARVFGVGKRCGRKGVTQQEINQLLVSYAREGFAVVRLKGGDPLIFGRAGEEMEALREVGIECEIVPGVTSSCAAAAAAQIPLTDRRSASKLILLTAHRRNGEIPIEWRDVASPDATLVIHMPGDDYVALAATLSVAELSAETPCVIVSRAGTAEEQIHRTSLGKLPDAPRLPAPALIIVGEVAAVEPREAHPLEKETVAAPVSNHCPFDEL